MEVNIESFKNVLLKSTLNYTTANVGFTVDEDNVKVGMRGDNFVIILNMENDMIPDIKGECEFYFDEPSNQVRTHLELLSGQEHVKIGLNDNKINLSSGGQRSTIHFCSSNLVPTYSGAGPQVKGTSIYEIKLDEEWLDKLDKVQRIASKFKKIYFTVKDGKVLIEATDKQNNYSNGLLLVLGRTDYEDVSMCFDFKSFNNAFKVLGEEYEDFTMTVNAFDNMDAGMVSFINDSESEKYYILSKSDDE